MPSMRPPTDIMRGDAEALRSFGALLLFATFAFTPLGCDDGGSEAPDDAVDQASDLQTDTVSDLDAQDGDVATLPDGPTVRFDLDPATSGSDFFAFPFPSDLRTTDGGAPLLDGLVANPTPLFEALETEIARTPGISPVATVYFTFEAALDPASLPADPPGSVADDATVYVVSLDPESQDYGQRHPVEVVFREQAGDVLPANVMLVSPLPGRPLRSDGRYAVVLTRSLTLSDGSPIGAQPLWEAIRGSVLPPDGVSAELHGHVRSLVAELDDAGVDTDDVVAASVFSTSDPAGGLDDFYAAVDALQFVSPSELTVVEQTAEHVLYEGTFELVEYIDAADIAAATTPGPLIERDDAGVPQEANRRDVTFSLLTPPEPRPMTDFYPLVVISPGAGAGHADFVEREGAALLQAGIATFSISAPLSGDRAGGIADPAALYDQIATQNPIGYRDLLFQALADQIQAYRITALLQIPSDVSPIGVALGLRQDPFQVSGHGFGGQALALGMGAIPVVDVVALSGAGGELGPLLVRRTSGGVAFGSELADALGVEASDVLDDDHPLVRHLLQPMLDPVDPIHTADRAFRAAPESPVDVLMVHGTRDAITASRNGVALAVGIGVPPVEPVEVDSKLFDAVGLEPVSTSMGPVFNNIMVDADPCERDPCAVSAGLLSYALGHESLYESEDALARYVIWFRNGAQQGVPGIVPPP